MSGEASFDDSHPESNSLDTGEIEYSRNLELLDQHWSDEVAESLARELAGTDFYDKLRELIERKGAKDVVTLGGLSDMEAARLGVEVFELLDNTVPDTSPTLAKFRIGGLRSTVCSPRNVGEKGARSRSGINRLWQTESLVDRSAEAGHARRDGEGGRRVIAKKSSPGGNQEAADLLTVYRNSSVDQRKHFVSSLDADEREGLTRAFADVERSEYVELVFGHQRPSIARFNQWLQQQDGREFSPEETKRLARAVSYIRDMLRAQLLFDSDNGPEECVVSTETRSHGQVRFTVRRVGSQQTTLKKQNAFPTLVAEKQ